MRNRRIAGALLAVGWITGCAASKPAGLGLVDQRLSACPARPNCVSTQAGRSAPDPLRYPGTRDEAREQLVAVLRSMPGARVVTVAPHYVRAEFTSPVFRFVDDVEAYLDPADTVIHLRSASRSGYSDFGTNRERLSEIGRRFSAGAELRRVETKKETAG